MLKGKVEVVCLECSEGSNGVAGNFLVELEHGRGTGYRSRHLSVVFNARM
jgi:hypothetical protein